MKGRIDTYTLFARFIPAVVSAFPLFVLAFFLSGDVQLRQLGQYLVKLKFYGGITLSVVGLYFYAEVIRFVSKLFQVSLFADGLDFPTTYLMTYSDGTHSRNYKDKYRTLIKRDFDIDLLDETAERSDPTEAKKRLREATKQVILKVGDGRLVLKHNKSYGLVRNLIGGAVFSLAFCVVGLLIGVVALRSACLIAVSLVLFVPYAFLLFFWKPLMKQNAEAYAQQLIGEYMFISATPGIGP
jgi:hypothetical protein